LWERYKNVISNSQFLIAGLAIGFQSMARYGLLIRVPVHFPGDDWKTSDTKWVSIALPVGMAPGAVVSGWVSDGFFCGNRSRVIQLFLFAAGCCSLGMYFLPRDNPWSVAVLFLTGFFAYGPQAALCPDLLGKKQAGTGTGVMNASACLFAGLGEPAIGALIDRSGETAIIFAIVSLSCFAGAVLSLGIRR